MFSLEEIIEYSIHKIYWLKKYPNHYFPSLSEYYYIKKR